ncbi:conserved hypothetical protein [Thermosulfidibacter takaii ABI70S6]|uniref:Gamma carbonic anhydrase family protein n=1 Tax=Thermosulfidibacter takaii (strain DSM 17441 / JCM 13301 / NBRC 103674 / ABI70S6) TaxID=1298851 RepID=A0A0S3QTD8_THET7|nr:gamma carbonic anhydrase family protein [Thermosulfidibacter takaii]BAT71597.1 conserved hypothetical protein [Thermosulfidibacter takaii ABI70S6]
MGKMIAYKGVVPKIGKDVFLAEGSFVIGDVEIGDNSSIWFNTVVRGDVNYIRIGNSTNIQDLTMVHVTTAKYPTIIGDNVTIGHRAMVHGCVIGNNCLIGMGAIILDGVKIGNNCLVAAGSLVTQGKEFPDGVLIMGSPAKVVRELTEEEIKGFQRLADHYSALAKSYLKD